MANGRHRRQHLVRFVTVYDPSLPPPPGRERGQKVYKLIISNEEDGRSLYTEILSMEYFRDRELNRAYPDKYWTIKFASIDREEEWEHLEKSWERIGVPRAEIEKTVYGMWALYEEIGYERKKKRFVDQKTA